MERGDADPQPRANAAVDREPGVRVRVVVEAGGGGGGEHGELRGAGVFVRQRNAVQPNLIFLIRILNHGIVRGSSLAGADE